MTKEQELIEMGFSRKESELSEPYLVWRPNNEQLGREFMIVVPISDLEDYENPDHYLCTFGATVFHLNFGSTIELMEIIKKISEILDKE